MPQNRHTVRAQLVFNEDQVKRLKADDSLRVMVYCGLSSSMQGYHPTDISFPNQIELKVNQEDIKANFKGLKNKPGSTKPTDITSFVRKHATYKNEIAFCYALTTKRYAYVINIVRHVKAAALTQRIRTARQIPKQKVIDEMNRQNADPDIAATSSKMSLKDPVSTMRIALPVRSTVCSHNQCFDGEMFMQLQEQAPTWQCPICSKHVNFDSLCVDKYFEEILNSTPKSIEQVTVEPNGDWSIVKEDEDKGKSNHDKGGARASYDDDFDDSDLLEISEPQKPQTNGMNGLLPGWQPAYSARLNSPFATPSFPINTPPLSSREPSVAQSTASAQRAGNKRPASSVIDLTLSDDEDDDPPRPAKRQTTATSQPSSASSYNTPASLSESRQQINLSSNLTNSYTGFNEPPQANGYRPQSNPGRPPTSSGPAVGTPHRFGQTSMPPASLSPQLPHHSPARQNGYAQGFAQANSRPPSALPGGGPNAFGFDPNRTSPHSSNTSNGPQPFSIRPPSQGPGQQQGALRLPPMHTLADYNQQYQQQTSGWRGDYNGYSSSPGG